MRFHRDKDYVYGKEVVIVDEFTGRMMSGRRRWKMACIQAVEAKEGVPIQPRTRRLASITFRLLPHVRQTGPA